MARNDGETPKQHNDRHAPQGGASSTLRLIDSIIDASGILDHPPSRVMTVECEVAISRHELPEFCLKLLALKSEGAGKTGCLLHPRSRVRFCANKNGTRAYRAAGAFRPSLRNGFTAYFVLSPENGSFASVATQELTPRNLAPAPRRPNHTTSPYASGAYV